MSGLYLDNDDVVCFGGEGYSFSKAPTATVSEMKSSLLSSWLAGHLSGWISSGIACRVLLAHGGGWQAGKIRFRMEFIPDKPKVPQQNPSTLASNPESSLDDLRSQLNPE